MFTKSCYCLLLIYVGGGGGYEAVVDVYKMASVVSSCDKPGFVPFAPSLNKMHFSRPRQRTDNVLKNIRVERNGLQSLKRDDDSKIHLDDDLSAVGTVGKMHCTNYSE